MNHTHGSRLLLSGLAALRQLRRCRRGHRLGYRQPRRGRPYSIAANCEGQISEGIIGYEIIV